MVQLNDRLIYMSILVHSTALDNGHSLLLSSSLTSQLIYCVVRLMFLSSIFFFDEHFFLSFSRFVSVAYCLSLAILAQSPQMTFVYILYWFLYFVCESHPNGKHFKNLFHRQSSWRRPHYFQQTIAFKWTRFGIVFMVGLCGADSIQIKTYNSWNWSDLVARWWPEREMKNRTPQQNISFSMVFFFGSRRVMERKERIQWLCDEESPQRNINFRNGIKKQWFYKNA